MSSEALILINCRPYRILPSLYHQPYLQIINLQSINRTSRRTTSSHYRSPKNWVGNFEAQQISLSRLSHLKVAHPNKAALKNLSQYTRSSDSHSSDTKSHVNQKSLYSRSEPDPHQISLNISPSLSTCEYKTIKLEHLRALKHKKPPGEKRSLSPRWFEDIKRNMSTKRARSPLPEVKPIGQDAEPVSKPKDVTDSGEVTDLEIEVKDGDHSSVTIPAFLCFEPSQMTYNFQDILWAERRRSMVAQESGTLDHPFHTIRTASTMRGLDRYGNIQPWNGNRVRLRGMPHLMDYINASPIRLESHTKDATKHAWISMQGPKENTTSHVWRMVYDEMASPAVIIMLTETHESGVEKCFPYFPLDESSDPIYVSEKDGFSDGFRATVRFMEFVENPHPDSIKIRKLGIRTENGDEEEKIVYHILYSAWPDFGVPRLEAMEPIYSLMSLSNAFNAGPENPRLIHCSAGVGRTGTYIALEYLLSELEEGVFISEESQEDLIYETVNQLREQRMHMVQAEAQYAFLHRVLRIRFEQKYPSSKPAATSAHDKGDGEPSAKIARKKSMDDVFQ